MIYGSVCSGMEAATAAWHPLDWRPSFFSEIDKTASRFLAAKYPDVPNLGDMTKFKDWPDAALDVLVGGTPCQSFSVAGLRRGLADPRGNLMLTYLAIVDRYRPHWLVWENVPGVLSSGGGRDFGAFLGGLAQLGYGFAYRVLDAQFVRVQSHPWAVPQRRRRVFVVGCLGAWRRAAAVLFERESLCRHPPPRREAGKGIAPGFANGAGSGGEWPAEVAPTFGTGWADRHPGSSNQDWIAQKGGHFVPAVAPTLDANMDKKWGSNQWVDNGFAIMLRANHDASEDGSGRGTPLVDFAQNQRNELRMMEVAGALSAQAGMKQQTYVQQEWAVRRLTPLECTRLQGFPDDYFDVPGKPFADGAKYKMLGNSMAVNVMRWIGERIQSVESITAKSEAA